MSDSTVFLYKILPKEHHYILTTVPKKTEVKVIRIDPSSGALQYSGLHGRDVFPDKETAEEYLTTLGIPQIEGSGVALLGYIVIGYTGLLLLVEKARTTASLPGSVNIKTISASRWYRLPCQADLTPLQHIEISNNIEVIENRISKIIEFPLQGAHWYSEDADVSRPFPSAYPCREPSWQFVWNEWLTQSFHSIGLGECCPSVMEGTAESRSLRDVIGDPFALVLLSRRSRLNAGTRYIARGLNDQSEPGNEIECEQIVWRYSKESRHKILWNRYSWRRGTVPIRWGVKLKSGGLGEAEIHIKKNRTFEGCRKYIRRVQKRFYPDQDLAKKLKSSGNAGLESSSKFPVVFISLLRKGLPDRYRSETDLAAAFDKALSIMRKTYGLDVPYYSVDWHEMDKQLGTQDLIGALWTTMRSTLETHGLASGYCTNVASNNDEDPTSLWCGTQCMHWISQQQGLARYNCADSLDRTNIASFFISVQVFIEQCRLLELAVLTEKSEIATTSKEKPSLTDRFLGLLPTSLQQTRPIKGTMMIPRRVAPKSQDKQKLPDGWERKVEPSTGRTFYVDHINKKTSWNLPCEDDQCGEILPDVDSESSIHSKKSFKTRCKEELESKEAWAMLNLTVEEVRQKVLPEALTSIAEVFLLNGDRNSFFYTGSQAMHSDKIMIFEPETSSLKKNGIGGAQNSLVAIHRRYNNLMKDSDRQAQIELFLGVNMEKHISSSSQNPIRDLDAMNIIYKPKALELDFLDTDDDDDEVNQYSYPALMRESGAAAINESQLRQLTPQRSQSSPVLKRVEDLSTESSEESEAIDGHPVHDADLKDNLNTSQPVLVPGLRVLPSTHNPLS